MFGDYYYLCIIIHTNTKKTVTMTEPVHFENFSKVDLLKGFNLVEIEFGTGYQPKGRTDRHLCGIIMWQSEGVFQGLELSYWKAEVFYFTLAYLKENNLKVYQKGDFFILVSAEESLK